MSVQIISNDAIENELENSGPVGIPLSEPPCNIRLAPRIIPNKEHISTGIWECSPGKFRREIKEGEVMHILSGECTFTPDGETVMKMKAGDTVFLPPNTQGVWDIKQTVRKVYVLV